MEFSNNDRVFVYSSKGSFRWKHLKGSVFNVVENSFRDGMIILNRRTIFSHFFFKVITITIDGEIVKSSELFLRKAFKHQ